MKKISLALLSILLSGWASAQSGLGIMGSVNVNTQIDDYNGETTSNQIKTGFSGGLIYEMSINRYWSIQPGLIYSLKGGQQVHRMAFMAADGQHESQLKDKNSLHYLELPLNIVYKIPTCSGHFFVGVGGYASVLMSAYTTSKYQKKVNGENMESMAVEGSRKLTIGDQAGDDLYRFDFGATGIKGYQMGNGLFIRGGVDAGLFDIILTDNITNFQSTLPPTVGGENPHSKNVTYMLGVGYIS